jgi:hypothetical protein
MVAIADEVEIPNLYQRHGRKNLPKCSCLGDSQPAPLGVILERVELTIKIGTAALTATDLVNRHCANARVDLRFDGAGCVDPPQVEEPPRAA